MDTKICTSIEQSKKLLSLGLDPSTADMGWNIFVDGTIRTVYLKQQEVLYGDFKL